ncbi:hypothetical protein N0V95_004469 [Ascochyta clinopodiicola]|nr:hypothetical protein N0V95_004469 [Ascochyta clinopodiicola]
MVREGDAAMVDAAGASLVTVDVDHLLQTNHSDAFAFTASEELALELYDQLQELELQQSLLRAQETGASYYDDLQEQLIVAEREAMEAKAEYEMRNRITHNVLVTDPVLKAVHGGEKTRLVEKRLLPLIVESDAVAMVHGRLASKLANTTRGLVAAEQANIVANQKNRELSKTMLALAEATKSQSTEDIEDPQLREQIRSVDKELKESRRRMKTLKGVLSAMIVGSGINWAADENLTELVMDDEDG